MLRNNASCEDKPQLPARLSHIIYFIVLHDRLVNTQQTSQNRFSQKALNYETPLNPFPASLMYLASKSSNARIELAGMAGKKRSLSSFSWKSAEKLWN